ncbi:MAG: ABC transporter ATP-binding protein [Bacillota bacterium]
MKRLLAFLNPYKKEIFLGPFFKLVEAVFELLIPALMALAINHGVKANDGDYVLKIGALMLALAVFGYASSMVCQYYASRASQRFGTSLRGALFSHVLKLSSVQAERLGASSLLARLINDVNVLQQTVAIFIRLAVRALFICAGSIVMVFVTNPHLALYLLAGAPVLGIIIYLIVTKSAPLYGAVQRALDTAARILRENLAGVRVVRAFARFKTERGRFTEANEDVARLALRVGRVSALLNPLTSLVVNAMILLLLWTGAREIDGGRLLQGDIVAFVNYVTQLLYSLIIASGLITLFTKAHASVHRIGEVLDETPAIADGENEWERDRASDAKIEFDHVSFAYAGGKPVFEDVSFCIRGGQTVGVIGGTGSGKSTLVNLIARFIDVAAGAVLVDGRDVRGYDLRELRAKIGMVPQRAALFSGTIAENIRWGNPAATGEEVVRAAALAQAHEFISALGEGYDTPVQRGGAGLSGGQKQRLTIARALVRRPEILILDDASSALDYATDAALRRALSTLEGVTVIVVSERVGAVRHCDAIAVLDDGALVAYGRHEELMERCAIYGEICASQLGQKEAAL